MAISRDLRKLDEILNRLATLYQFRSLDERLYDTLTVSQSYCLRILYFQGARSMTELAAELHVRLSTMTGVVDQLEEKRLVARVDHPEDRRSLRVTLTGRGKKLYQAAHEAFIAHIEPLLAGRSVADRERLLGFLGEVTRAVQGWRDDLRKVRRNGKTHS